MQKLLKPKALKQGDKVASVSLSWGGAGVFRAFYQKAKKQFETTFDVRLVEMPHTLDTPQELYDNPAYRLDDLMQAFLDPSVRAILCTIGGDDTIRLLSHMTDKHFDIIRKNPKIFLGMSDTTVNHFMCLKAGLSSFYGPSLMYGYAEPDGVPELTRLNTLQTLFNAQPIGILQESQTYRVERFDWAQDNPQTPAKLSSPHSKYIQGRKSATGRLIGGCMEVLNMINGTPLWPNLDQWQDTILFLETSEEMPPASQLLYFLRNLGAQGVLDKLQGILFARPGGDFAPDQQQEQAQWLAHFGDYDKALLQALAEFERSDIPVVTHMDFGHTVPQNILPYGVLCEIDPVQKRVAILESAVV